MCQVLRCSGAGCLAETPEDYSLIGLLSAAPHLHGHQWHCEDVDCIKATWLHGYQGYMALRRESEGYMGLQGISSVLTVKTLGRSR